MFYILTITDRIKCIFGIVLKKPVTENKFAAQNLMLIHSSKFIRNQFRTINKSINIWAIKLFIHGKLCLMSCAFAYVYRPHSHSPSAFITIINICISLRFMGLTRIKSVYPFNGCSLRHVRSVLNMH